MILAGRTVDCCGATHEADCRCYGDPCPVCRSCEACCACDLFRCGECGAWRFNPPAGSDEAECVGDPPRMVPCGKPLCEDCTRRGSSCPEYNHLITDGGPAI